jgi:hypothetical protein
MLKHGFVVAMAAELSFAVYERPAAILRKLKQWMIVSRCGPNSEFVTIASAAGMVTPGCDAPLGLTPIKTAVGILSSESADESSFLLVRQRPPVLPIAGAFFPADGHMRMIIGQGTLELLGVGRHAHSLGRLDGRWIRKDVPDPPRMPAALWPGIYTLFGRSGSGTTPLEKCRRRAAHLISPDQSCQEFSLVPNRQMC